MQVSKSVDAIWMTCDSKSEIASRQMMKGDIVDWDTAVFETVNMTVEDNIAIETVCTAERPGHVILPEKRTFEDHR